MVSAAPRPFSWSPKVCFTATIPYINPNFRYWLGERYTNHTSILLPLNTISPPQNVFYKDHHKHKISLFFYSLITSLGLTDDSVHYFSSSPFKTCFHSKTKTALHQWLQNSISLMNFLLITSCSHCRINIWNIPASMLHTSYHYHWFQPTEEIFTFTFLMLAYLTQAPFSFLQ